MGRIVFISHRHDDLVPTIIKKVPEAVALTSFKLEIQRGMCCVGFLLLMSM